LVVVVLLKTIGDLTLGRKIKKYREIKGLSQQELADLAGCSRPNISKVENDEYVPSMKLLQGIADALGLKLTELVDLEAELGVDVLLNMAQIQVYRQEYAEAMQTLDEVEKRGDLQEYYRYRMILFRSDCLMRTGQQQQAIHELTQLLQVLESTPGTDQHLLADVLNRLGNAYYFANNRLNAYANYLRAYQISSHFPKPDMLFADISYNLGNICRYLRLHSEAEKLLAQAVAFYESVADQRLLADALFVLGVTYKHLNDTVNATEFLQRSCSLYESLNLQKLGRMARRHYAFYVVAPEDPEQAVTDLLNTLSQMEMEKDVVNIAYTYARISVIYLEHGNLSEAGRYIELARQYVSAEYAGECPEFAYVYQVKAKYHLQLEEYERCLQDAFRAAELFSRMELDKEKADSLEVAVTAYRKQGKLEEALAVSEEVRSLLKRSLEFLVIPRMEDKLR
jgi:transcriptional regulator with XRE-family HTH domain